MGYERFLEACSCYAKTSVVVFFLLTLPVTSHFQFLIPSAGLQAPRNRVGRTSSDWSIKINYQESTVQPSSGALFDVAIFEHDFGFHLGMYFGAVWIKNCHDLCEDTFTHNFVKHWCPGTPQDKSRRLRRSALALRETHTFASRSDNFTYGKPQFAKTQAGAAP